MAVVRFPATSVIRVFFLMFNHWKTMNLEMFLDLCNIGNAISAEIFLEIICELRTCSEGVCFLSGEGFQEID